MGRTVLQVPACGEYESTEMNVKPQLQIQGQLDDRLNPKANTMGGNPHLDSHGGI